MQRELGKRSFEEVLDESEQIWERILNRIHVEGAKEDQRKIFYSCLYRAHLSPRAWYEYDESDDPHHFSPYDGQVHPGSCLRWDTTM